ncbi:corticoliberin [Hyaena hyaena]|uniref:corticoliberin n=1 Tax=Hyaena hyaena TaxID=95912 RepID=UPI001923404A|nr:corticoliberin [Hyaena hyaena]XP_039102896.1 corticoliberin [Hyaena hyaena]XP_039102897.1 corticoliberin [Hyaena hyaena]XP_039102898.1 corticoliberin [Hyaena hyaena]XP_039102899.1 corticoliberin [Hyaena hyaena]
MRLPLLWPAGALLLALLPGPPCGALLSRGPAPPQPRQPALLRVGEEYFLRLGDLGKSPAAPLLPASPPVAGGSGGRLAPDEAAANLLRVLLQQQQPLPRRPPSSPAGPAEPGAGSALGSRRETLERPRRSEEPPISLDLTFHLLREVLEMARAEQLAQQAHSNRKLMEIIGK